MFPFVFIVIVEIAYYTTLYYKKWMKNGFRAFVNNFDWRIGGLYWAGAACCPGICGAWEFGACVCAIPRGGDWRRCKLCGLWKFGGDCNAARCSCGEFLQGLEWRRFHPRVNGALAPGGTFCALLLAGERKKGPQKQEAPLRGCLKRASFFCGMPQRRLRPGRRAPRMRRVPV